MITLLEAEKSLEEMGIKEKEIANKIKPIKYEIICINGSKCIRCNLCYKACPVNAIEMAKIRKPASIIKEKCVKCEICVQTCPVNAIYAIEGIARVEDNHVKYKVYQLNIPHRKIRLKNYSLDKDKCIKCGLCAKYCPTNAIKVEIRKSIDVDLSLCMGCSACQEVCPKKAIKVENEIGEVIKTKEIEFNKDLCVGCFVCLENCPVNAIEQDLDKIKINKNKCIYCGKCEEVCPMDAIKLFRIHSQ